MDPRLFEYYRRELQHIRSSAGEFAREFPKVAQRLSLDGFECKDPYVERLLEGFAFLTARIQLKLDAQFPVFTQHILDILYPQYLAPTPSMAVVALTPHPRDGMLPAGLPLPRGTSLRSLVGPEDRTACEYRTAHDLNVVPLVVEEVAYLDSAAAVSSSGLPLRPNTKAALRIRLGIQGGLCAEKLEFDHLDLFLSGTAPIPAYLFEALHCDALGFHVRARDEPAAKPVWHERACIARRGWSNDEALLPEGLHSFSGYRLLREYFALPERFLFARLSGMRPALAAMGRARSVEIVVPLAQPKPGLARLVDASCIRLNCVPAINLFPTRVDRINVDPAQREFQLIVDRTKPRDFEVHSVTRVEGFGADGSRARSFTPFFAPAGAAWHGGEEAHFTLRREPRMQSTRERQHGARANYHGGEVFIALLDAQERPMPLGIKQLGVNALATNRDLPLQLPIGRSTTDFHIAGGAPLESCRCVAGPTSPIPSFAYGDTAWRAISFFALNSLSITNESGQEGVAALRELLTLHCTPNDQAHARQIAGIRSVDSRPRVLRMPVNGSAVFGRGVQVTLTVDELAFEGTSPVLLGAVLDEFFARYAHVNSFSETVLAVSDRGEVMRWPARLGATPLI